ncbi:MAG: NACHT domain-containing protein [Methylobacter sp.]
MQTSYQTILPAQAPEMAAFVDIKNNHTLLRYFQNLQQHFMYANNFGLALDDEDRPDSAQPQAYLRNLFVPPHLSKNHFHPEQLITAEQQNQNQNWLDVAQVLKDNPRLFILGDPGAGKSTLLSWLMLALSYSGDNLTKMMIGERVPFLLVLRDLPLSQVNDWDSLWQIFLDNNSNKLTAPFSKDQDIIAALFKNGQGLLLIDGLDEVTQPQVRQQLGQAVLEGINRYPRCGFVITSRLLGFDQEQWFGLDADRVYQHFAAALAVVKNQPNKKRSNKHPSPIVEWPKLSNNWQKRFFEVYKRYLDHEEVLKNATSASINISQDKNSWKDWLEISSVFEQPNLPVFYLASFDIAQTQQFIKNWYRQYLNNDKALPQRIAELQRRIIENDGLGHLARIPVLLNMICFIHSRRGRLPDGRAELYQRIAETYLTSLDRARGLKFRDREFNYDYLDLCEWLGKLALKLQDNRNADDQALLINQQQVKILLHEELTDRGMDEQQTEEEVEFILAYIAQRSGLFIPRGKNTTNQEQYGFSHLSFLEYFAAFSLKQEAQIDSQCLTERQLTTAYSWWHECWALLFEQLEHSRLTEKYLNLLFGHSLNSQHNDLLKPSLLLAKIIMDSSVRLAIQVRHAKIKELWGFYLTKNWIDLIKAEECPAFCELMWSDRFDSRSICLDYAIVSNIKALFLTGKAIYDLSPLAGLNQLTNLNLSNTSISDLSPLAGLSQLIVLDLDHTAISDLSPLAGLSQLTGLGLGNTSISDLSPLAGLNKLTFLILSETAISNLSTLAALNQLTNLDLFHTAISDLSPLAGLSQLTNLDLGLTAISDLSPLAGLSQLTNLRLGLTAISDLSPLAGLSQLTNLDLRHADISDLSPLAGLNQLTNLNLSNTSISDLSPLAGLNQLTNLDLCNTSISDLSPLAGLNQLTNLNLSNTSISDLSPLAGLNQLTGLDLNHTAISDLSPLAGLNQLIVLDLSDTVIDDLISLSKLNNLKHLYLPSKDIEGVNFLKSKNVNIILTAKAHSSNSPRVYTENSKAHQSL